MNYKTYSIKSIVAVSMCIILLFSCSKSSPEPNPTTPNSCAGVRGLKFNAVKNLIAAKCQSCHGASRQEGGQNYSIDCNIVSSQARIKSRAVDIGDMPKGGPMLTAGEKDIITDWINAGGLLSN